MCIIKCVVNDKLCTDIFILTIYNIKRICSFEREVVECKIDAAQNVSVKSKVFGKFYAPLFLQI